MQRYLSLFLMLLVFALPSMGFSQTLELDMDTGGSSATARIIQMVMLIGVLSIAPSLLVMVTSFTRVVVVLAFVRTALGTQTTPPNQVLIALAMFLTAFIMTPVFQQSYNDGLLPLMEERVSEEEGISRAAQPFRLFMLKHVRERDLRLFMDMRDATVEKAEQTPYELLIPAFMVSELRRAFEIGFLIFVPFLIIDILIASILMAMGMMMLSPIIISLPFKIMLFVLVDGWAMVMGSVAASFNM